MAHFHGIWLGVQSQALRLALTGMFAFPACCARVPAQLLQSQDPQPSFEVASIRPSPTDSLGTSFQIAPLRFRVVDATLNTLVQFAYNIRSDDQLEKGPRWAAIDRFDVDAKIDDAQAEATKKMMPDQQIDRYRLMLQSLLTTRFALRVSTTTRDLPVYALEVLKSGAEMNPTAVPSGSEWPSLPRLAGWSRGELEAHAVSMSLFAEELSGKDDLGGRVVIDATDLAGTYDFKLHWTPFTRQLTLSSAATSKRTPGNSGADTGEVPLSTALEEQLGLKLVPRRAPVKVLVIVHVDHPSPN
jgi:bla regulator protein blaR1